MTAPAIILTACLLSQATQDTAYDRAARVAQRLEIKERNKAPPWYPPGPVRFTFAQITDVHLHAGRETLLEKACRFVRGRERLAFVVFTGDDTGSSQPSRKRRFSFPSA